MQAKINFADLNYRLWLGALALLVFASALLSSPPALSQAFPGGGGRNGDVAEVLKSLNLGGGGNFGGGSTPRPAVGPGKGNRTWERNALEQGEKARQKPPRLCRFEPLDDRGRSLLEPSFRSGAGGQAESAEFQARLDQMRVMAERFHRPSEYELYVKNMTGLELCRFGFDFADDLLSLFEPPPLSAVPDDYVLGAGDEVYLRIWGSASEQDISLVIDRSGLVFVPRVGPVKLGGVRFGDAAGVVRKVVRTSFSDMNVAVTLGELRGIRVYVTGHALKPGAYTVSNLASLSSVLLAAGGPGPSGSFRHLELRRAGKAIAIFDLYDLLMRGDKSADRLLVNEDVIFVAPVGPQVAVLGGVNKPAIYEVESNETAADLVTMAGGFLPGVGVSSLRVLPIAERARGFQVLAEPSARPLISGDIFMFKNDTRAQLPSDQRNSAVHVEGQVRQPGQYFLPPGSTLEDAIAAAGGLTPGAYLYGLRLTRESVRVQQEATLLRMLRELDRDLVAAGTISPTNSEEAKLMQTRAEVSRTLVERLQAFQPDGRVMLPIAPAKSSLPIAALENGDRINVPSIPNEVSVFGSVVSAGSFLFAPGSKIQDYVNLAGGPRKGADVSESFVIRANGEAARFEGAGRGLLPIFSDSRSAQVFPGDTVVVPENMNKTTVYRELASFATLLYQFGLGAAALKVLKD